MSEWITKRRASAQPITLEDISIQEKKQKVETCPTEREEKDESVLTDKTRTGDVELIHSFENENPKKEPLYDKQYWYSFLTKHRKKKHRKLLHPLHLHFAKPIFVDEKTFTELTFEQINNKPSNLLQKNDSFEPKDLSFSHSIQTNNVKENQISISDGICAEDLNLCSLSDEIHFSSNGLCNAEKETDNKVMNINENEYNEENENNKENKIIKEINNERKMNMKKTKPLLAESQKPINGIVPKKRTKVVTIMSFEDEIEASRIAAENNCSQMRTDKNDHSQSLMKTLSFHNLASTKFMNRPLQSEDSQMICSQTVNQTQPLNYSDVLIKLQRFEPITFNILIQNFTKEELQLVARIFNVPSRHRRNKDFFAGAILDLITSGAIQLRNNISSSRSNITLNTQEIECSQKVIPFNKPPLSSTIPISASSSLNGIRALSAVKAKIGMSQHSASIAIHQTKEPLSSESIFETVIIKR